MEEQLSRKEWVKRNEDEILNYIKKFVGKYHYSPTVREIAKNSRLSSSSTVLIYLNKLKNKGLIDWEAGRPRTIKILEG